jgi:hypothetical protein
VRKDTERFHGPAYRGRIQTVRHHMRLECEGDLRPSALRNSTAMASFEFAPGAAGIICKRPYCDRRAVVTAPCFG